MAVASAIIGGIGLAVSIGGMIAEGVSTKRKADRQAVAAGQTRNLQISQIDSELSKALEQIEQNRDLSMGQIEVATFDKNTSLSKEYTTADSNYRAYSGLSGATGGGSNATIKDSINQKMQGGLDIVERDRELSENEINILSQQNQNNAQMAASHGKQNANQNYNNAIAGLPTTGDIIAGTILGATGAFITGATSIVSNYLQQSTPAVSGNSSGLGKKTSGHSSKTYAMSSAPSLFG